MSDGAWQKRFNKIFPNMLYPEKSFGESIDQFIGKLRQLEDGNDPHAKDRMPINVEYSLNAVYDYYERPFRDQRDQQLWEEYSFGQLSLTPSLRKTISSTLKNIKKANQQWRKNYGN